MVGSPTPVLSVGRRPPAGPWALGLADRSFLSSVALLLDATLIRTVVLPSTLVVLGRWSW